LAKFSYAMGGTSDIFGHWLYNALANPVFVEVDPKNGTRS